MSFNPNDYTTNPEAFLAENVTFTIMFVTDILTLVLSQLYQWRELATPNNAPVDKLDHAHRVVREVTDEEDISIPSESSKRQFKLTLRDSRNNYCFAYDYRHCLPWLIPRGNPGSLRDLVPVPLGSTLLVKRGTLIEYGVLQLTVPLCELTLGEDSVAAVSAHYVKVLEQQLAPNS